MKDEQYFIKKKKNLKYVNERLRNACYYCLKIEYRNWKKQKKRGMK